MGLADRAAADLGWVAAYWEDLVDSRIYGTPPPFRKAYLDAQQREERDWQAQLDRWERTAQAIGVSPAPLRVPVLDLVTGLLVDAEDVAAELGRAMLCPLLVPPSSGLDDARPYLAYAAARLREIGDLDVEHIDLERWAHGQARRMMDTVARALCLVYDGQRLDISCPWCRGVTPESPAGGEYTWRVRDLLAWKACEHGLHDRRFCQECQQQIVIVCENDCEPPSKSVGTWWRGRPCWPIYEWDWLAKQVQSERMAG